jgi:hypothetical protein
MLAGTRVHRADCSDADVLQGTRFPDAIANGSYRVDIHSAIGDGIILRYLDGREEELFANGTRADRRWRGATATNPTFYQIPYRSLVPQHAQNVLVAGRCIDTEPGAFGATRVMVNTGQTGHAAGVAAWLALDTQCNAAAVEPVHLRALLARQAAIVV